MNLSNLKAKIYLATASLAGDCRARRQSCGAKDTKEERISQLICAAEKAGGRRGSMKIKTKNEEMKIENEKIANKIWRNIQQKDGTEGLGGTNRCSSPVLTFACDAFRFVLRDFDVVREGDNKLASGGEARRRQNWQAKDGTGKDFESIASKGSEKDIGRNNWQNLILGRNRDSRKQRREISTVQLNEENCESTEKMQRSSEKILIEGGF